MSSKQETASERTAGPWQRRGAEIIPISAGPFGVAVIATFHCNIETDQRGAEALAEQAVREHNAHDALVAALRGMERSWTRDRVSDSNPLMVAARAALAQAEGKAGA